MADLPTGIHDLTDAGWLALAFVPPEDGADWIAAVALGLMRPVPDEVPGYHELTPKGRAYLDAAAALWAGLDRGLAAMLSHALGIGRGEQRNHYVCGIGSTDFAGWESLAAAGLAERGRNMNDGSDAVFRTTPLGRAVVRAGGAA